MIYLRIKFLTVLLACGFAAAAQAQTSISQRVVPNPNGPTTTPPQARLPLPPNVTAQPTAVLPANPDEMRRRIASAVEDILALYGNPPFAEVITNDQVRAATLRGQLALIAKADSLNAEVATLTATRDNLANQVEAKEKELAYFREQASTLQQTLAASLDRLTKVPAAPANSPGAGSASNSPNASTK